jgi:hypothetical protein
MQAALTHHPAPRRAAAKLLKGRDCRRTLHAGLDDDIRCRWNSRTRLSVETLQPTLWLQQANQSAVDKLAAYSSRLHIFFGEKFATRAQMGKGQHASKLEAVGGQGHPQQRRAVICRQFG